LTRTSICFAVVGLANGGADFYAADEDGLRREGEISLRAYLDMA
jgi:predicted HicB family RNase H-like nuclease